MHLLRGREGGSAKLPSGQGRIAAIDFGKARIGVALSDPLQLIAIPQKTLAASPSLQKTALTIATFLKPHLPLAALLIGLPLHMNGEESPLSAEVRKLALFLEEALSLQPLFWDERLTTAQVERHLREMGLTRKKRASLVDGCAAALILQNCLDAKKAAQLS